MKEEEMNEVGKKDIKKNASMKEGSIIVGMRANEK